MTSISNLTEDLKHKIKQALKEVVVREHSTSNKQTLRDMQGRIVLACPYCGDSHTDDTKKRGNIYWDTLQYHCYNCGYHTNLYSFLKDHDVRMPSTGDSFDIIDYIKANERSVKKVEIVRHNVFLRADELAIPVDKFKKYFNATNIEPGDWIWFKLKERLLHQLSDQFLYTEKDQKLWILNLTPNGNILSAQSRRMKGNGSRYLTYDLPKLYEEMGLELDISEEEKVNISKISTLFGIMQVNFQRDVTIFEGPLDAKFMTNSLALATAGRSTDELDEMATVRYMFDNDKTGKDKMTEKLRRGRPIFMWSKFLKENKLDTYNIKDLNDLMIVCYREKSEAYKKINEYFTTSPLDLWYV
jgi:hypothetical protein